MRWWLCLVVLAGCDGLFENNPDFGTDSDVDATTTPATGTTTIATDAATATESTAATVATDPETLGETASGSSGDSGSSSTGESVCGIDPYEPNNAQTALFLAGDLDSDQGSIVLEGHIGATTDDDWFKVNLAQVGANPPLPTLDVVADEDVAVCVFLQCRSKPVLSVTCPDGATPSSGAGLTEGCCATNSVSFPLDCEGASGEGFAHFRIRATSAIEECLPYVATFTAVTP